MDDALKRYIKEVLSFYADKDNYYTTSTGFAAQYDPAQTNIDKDKGDKARTAIKLLD